MSARFRLRAALLVAAIAALACAGLAFAAPGDIPITISAKVTVSPNKAGTAKHPQGVVIDVQGKINIPLDYDPPLTETVDVWISRNGNYNGGKFPTCSQATMDSRGVGACPKGSIMGKGTARALADTVPTYPQITVVNGGSNMFYLFTVLTNPARVAKPIPVSVQKLPTGKWGYKLHATIPKSLQIVAGIPLRLQTFHIKAGKGDWVATTSCPSSHKWTYHSEAHFDTGQTVKYDGSVPCRR